MNIFKQLVKSIYSPKTIAMFRLQGIGKTILYVFLLSLIATLPMAFYFGNSLASGLKEFDKTLQNELPNFSIENGTLISEDGKAIEIRKEDFIIIFDPSDTYSDNELNNKENALAFLKNKFVIVSNGISQPFEYKVLNQDLSKQELIEITKQFDSLVPLMLAILFIIMYLVNSFTKFIDITVLALFGIIFKNAFNRKLNFKQIWIVSAYSITMATIFFTLMDAFQAVVPFAFTINWFVHLIILHLVIKEIPAIENR
ncbi:DUF1189 domain-containing protein [Metabacillus fastidiosus]|uniref:DUF1189 domain-containing protein n=1 Tax=Metabacillus fastidiosus TaxID=1458 RepID=UPI003D265993